MTYIAHFQPQAWVSDWAVDVDDEGPDTWNCTEFLSNLDTFGENEDYGFEIAVELAEATQGGGSWLDKDDILKRDPKAPEWVREWSGPFTITVELEE